MRLKLAQNLACQFLFLTVCLTTIFSYSTFGLANAKVFVRGDAISIPCGNGMDVTSALLSSYDEASKDSPHAVVLVASSANASCILSHSLRVFPNSSLLGKGYPTLTLNRTGIAFIATPASVGFRIADIRIDGSAATGGSVIDIRGASEGVLENISVNDPVDGLAISANSSNITVKNFTENKSRGHGISIRDSHDNIIDGAVLNGQHKFGIILSGTSYGNHLANLITNDSGLELVGMTAGTHNNSLIDSKASRTGDNCYSITGNNNSLRNLEGDHCAGNGLAFYGSYNTIKGGMFTNNAQKHDRNKSWLAGVVFSQGFGGVAQHNLVENVTVIDDQTPHTQSSGIDVYPAQYKAWKTGEKFSIGSYVRDGDGLYTISPGDGTISASAAVEQQRPSSGGAWKRVASFRESNEPDFNTVKDCKVFGFGSTSIVDTSRSLHNIGMK